MGAAKHVVSCAGCGDPARSLRSIPLDVAREGLTLFPGVAGLVFGWTPAPVCIECRKAPGWAWNGGLLEHARIRSSGPQASSTHSAPKKNKNKKRRR